MGLWNKGVQRSLTGTPRLEDNPINVHVLEQIRKYIDTSGNNITEDRGYKCSYNINNRKVIFRIYGYSFSVIVPEGEDNLSYIMQYLSHAIEVHLWSLPSNYKPKQRLELLHRNIEFNKKKWRETKTMRTKDEMFLHIEYEK